MNRIFQVLTLRKKLIFSDEPRVVEHVGHNKVFDVVNILLFY